MVAFQSFVNSDQQQQVIDECSKSDYHLLCEVCELTQTTIADCFQLITETEEALQGYG